MIRNIIWTILNEHFASRDDIYHVVTGPKRETWFSAECIAALSRAQADAHTNSVRVSGEERWEKILQLINSSSHKSDTVGLDAMPDITALRINLVGQSADPENAPVSMELAWLAEVKLIDDWDFDLGRKSKLKSKAQDLGTQLDRAKFFVPDVPAIGLIFAIHISGRGDDEFRRLRGCLASAKTRRASVESLLHGLEPLVR